MAPVAQFFVESRLLQREITVWIETVTNQTFLATIMHPTGNIAEFLLREGLASCMEWRLTSLTPEVANADTYRKIEQEAKDRRVNLWTNYQPPEAPKGKAKTDEKKGAGPKSEYCGTVSCS